MRERRKRQKERQKKERKEGKEGRKKEERRRHYRDPKWEKQDWKPHNDLTGEIQLEIQADLQRGKEAEIGASDNCCDDTQSSSSWLDGLMFSEPDKQYGKDKGVASVKTKERVVGPASVNGRNSGRVGHPTEN